jgi:hypothetical protein
LYSNILAAFAVQVADSKRPGGGGYTNGNHLVNTHFTFRENPKNHQQH